MRFTNFTTIACSVQICNFTPLANSMYSMPNDYITRVNIETRPKGTSVIYLQRLSDMKKVHTIFAKFTIGNRIYQIN